MAEPIQRRAFDLMLAIAAVVVCATLMALHGRAPETPRVGMMDIREMELNGRLLEAQAAWSPALRMSIGLPQSNAEDEALLVASVMDRVTQQFPWSQPMRLAAAALLTAFDHDDEAREVLKRQVQGDANSVSHVKAEALIRGLLEKSKPLDFPGGAQALRTLGVSSWLVEKLRVRYLVSDGQASAATNARNTSAAMSEAYVGQLTFLVVVGIGFGFLGVLILLTWGVWSPRLRAKGISGLLQTVSPFRYESTVRIVAAWFLAHGVLGALLSQLMLSVGIGPGWTTSIIVLFQGAVVLLLIQAWGRREGDPRSLNECLRLKSEHLPGGPLGLLGWSAFGFSLTVAVTFIAFVVNHVVWEEISGRQSALETLIATGSLPELLILVAAYSVFAPLFEEILFRGFIYRNIRDRVGPTVALVASSLLFAIAHLDAQNMLPLFGIGLSLGLLYEKSGSLIVPIVVHGLWNGFTVIKVLSFVGTG